jgi:hypothetical protein
LNFNPANNDIVIFDEADDFIYENPGAFKDFICNRQSICFTATLSGESSIERQVLSYLNLKVYDNSLNVAADSILPINFKQKKVYKDMELYQHLNSMKKTMATVSYMSAQKKKFLKDQGLQFFDLDR